MDIEIKAPGFPESVADGSVISWHKQPGDFVKRDEVLVDIETDKVMFEVPAIKDGILKKIVATVGETVVSQQLLAILDDAGTAVTQEAASPAEKNASAAVNGTDNKVAAVMPIAPAARNLISEQGLDAAQIKGTGKGGRILKEDVQRYLSQQSATVDTPGKNTPDNMMPEQVKPTKATPEDASRATQFINELMDAPREKRVPMTRLRARIAERLLEAQQTAAILTTFNEVNMQQVMDLRQRYKDRFEQTHGVKLGFMSFFVKAAVEALKRFPAVNAAIEGNDIVYHNYFDIGIAVGSPRGLVVPILRNAESSSLAAVESQINGYAAKAKDGTLALEDMIGGTFTITNGGVFGSLMSTPILNPPQSAILGMHKIEQRAVVEDGNIVARPMMYLALSYDHRIIDGQEAVQFLVAIKDMLEDPARIMLEI